VTQWLGHPILNQDSCVLLAVLMPWQFCSCHIATVISSTEMHNWL